MLPVSTDSSSVSAVSSDELTFTPNNLELAPDRYRDGGQRLHGPPRHALFSPSGPAGGDPVYQGMTPSAIPGLSEDTNQASLVVDMLTSATLKDTGGAAEFSVALSSIPSSSVTVSLSPADSSTSSDATLSATS